MRGKLKRRKARTGGDEVTSGHEDSARHCFRAPSLLLTGKSQRSCNTHDSAFTQCFAVGFGLFDAHHGKKRTRVEDKRREMVGLVRRGKSMHWVAAQFKVDPSTVWRWIHRAQGLRLDRAEFSDGKPGRAWNRTKAQLEAHILEQRRIMTASAALPCVAAKPLTSHCWPAFRSNGPIYLSKASES